MLLSLSWLASLTQTAEFEFLAHQLCYTMERVQFQQEQMLAELKDLEQKGLFSQVCMINTVVSLV